MCAYDHVMWRLCFLCKFRHGPPEKRREYGIVSDRSCRERLWNILIEKQTRLIQAETLLCGQASDWPKIIGSFCNLIFFSGEWDENTDNIWGVWKFQVGTEFPRCSLQLDCYWLGKGNITRWSHVLLSTCNFSFSFSKGLSRTACRL